MDLLFQTLQSLRSRFEEHNNLLTIQGEEGATLKVSCYFNNPAHSEEIEIIAQRGKLPKDYLEFLKLCNGIKLFVDQYGGGIFLFSTEEITKNIQPYMPTTWIPIGQYLDDWILIDTTQSETNEYLIWQDHNDSFNEPTIRFKISFSVWLDRLVISQGSKFWRWNQ